MLRLELVILAWTVHFKQTQISSLSEFQGYVCAVPKQRSWDRVTVVHLDLCTIEIRNDFLALLGIIPLSA